MTDEEFEARWCVLRLDGYEVKRTEIGEIYFTHPKRLCQSPTFRTERWAWTGAWKEYNERQNGVLTWYKREIKNV